MSKTMAFFWHSFGIVIGLLLAGCALVPERISGTPAAGSLPIPITNPTIVTDLQSAAYNLDNALAVGALAANDPAPGCLHGILVKAGIEIPAGTVAPKSFAPKNDGVASAGAIAYILAQQAKQITKGGFTVDPSCEALLGRVVIDGVTAVNKTVLSIPGFLKLP
jgi:hypothetical protein